MCISTGGASLIRWGTRLLYVALFIALLVACGQWGNIRTWLFVGSVVCLDIPLLMLLKAFEQLDITDKNEKIGDRQQKELVLQRPCGNMR